MKIKFDIKEEHRQVDMYKENKVKLILLFICIVNLMFILLQENPLNNLTVIFMQVILGVFLFFGSNIARLWFIASVMEEFFYLQSFKQFAISVDSYQMFDGSIYLIGLQAYCLFTFLILIFNRGINKYINEKNIYHKLKGYIAYKNKHTLNEKRIK